MINNHFHNQIFCKDDKYLRFVGKTSVMRQSNAALPQEMTELKTALTIKLFCLLYTKYIAAEHIPADIVENTKKSL